MKGKLMLLAGAAAGYVLGTRAGRERYEQIKQRVGALWGDPHVQRAVSRVEDGVKDTASDVQDRLSGAVKDAADAATSFMHRDDRVDQPDQSVAGPRE